MISDFLTLGTQIFGTQGVFLSWVKLLWGNPWWKFLNNDFIAQNLYTDVYSIGFAINNIAINNSCGIQVNKDTPKHDIVLAEFRVMHLLLWYCFAFFWFDLGGGLDREELDVCSYPGNYSIGFDLWLERQLAIHMNNGKRRRDYGPVLRSYLVMYLRHWNSHTIVTLKFL